MDLLFGSMSVAWALATASTTAMWIEHQRNAELETRLSTDELTGLPNRRALRRQVRGCQAGGTPWSLLLADVDGFKQVNDWMGHAAGDRLLVHLGCRLARAAAAGGGQAFRLHGDEFVVLLPCSASDAVVYAHELVDSISWPVPVRQAGIGLGLSIGVIAGSRRGRLERFLDGADVAMYAAKRNGTRAVLYQTAEPEQPRSAAAGRRRWRDFVATRPGARSGRRRFVFHYPFGR